MPGARAVTVPDALAAAVPSSKESKIAFGVTFTLAPLADMALTLILAFAPGCNIGASALT
jgi:hypothetical protein